VTIASADILCARIASRLAESVGDQKYKMWFDRTTRWNFNATRSQLALVVPSRFFADRIGKHFHEQVCQAASSELGHDVGLDLRVDPNQFATPAPDTADGPSFRNAPQDAAEHANAHRPPCATRRPEARRPAPRGDAPALQSNQSMMHAGAHGAHSNTSGAYAVSAVSMADADRAADNAAINATDNTAATAAYPANAVSPASPAPAHRSNRPSTRRTGVRPPDAKRLDARFRHKLDDYVVGPANQLAYVAAQRLLQQGTDADNAHVASTLVLHGGCGLGKTHLLQGACRALVEHQPGLRALYISAEEFTNQFLQSVRHNEVDKFRRKIRRLDLLAVDDVQFMANKKATQQEFLHSFDKLELSGARLILASDVHPRQLPQFAEGLVSRCLHGMVVEIAPPDRETRERIIRAMARRRQMLLPEEAVELIARRCLGSIREIEGAITKLEALRGLNAATSLRSNANVNAAVSANGNTSTQRGRAGHGSESQVAMDLVHRLFDEAQLPTPRRAVQVQEIIDRTAAKLDVTLPQIMGAGRQKRVVLARGVIALLSRTLTSQSYPDIARAMGRSSHSTVIAAEQRTTQQIAAGLKTTLVGSHEELTLGELCDRLTYEIQKAS